MRLVTELTTVGVLYIAAANDDQQHLPAERKPKENMMAPTVKTLDFIKRDLIDVMLSRVALSVIRIIDSFAVNPVPYFRLKT